MGLDMYIERTEIKPVSEEVCYWRKNHDLMEFIRNNLFPYGLNEYAQKRELTVNDLIAIKRFLEKQGDNGAIWGENISKINEAIGELSAGDGSVKYHFSADW